jgi:hypothetical protein
MYIRKLSVRSGHVLNVVGHVLLSMFHLTYFKMSDTEYSFLMYKGESTFKRASCVKALRENTELTLLLPRSFQKKVVSLEREESLFARREDSDSLSVQLETARLRVVIDRILVDNLVLTVLKISEEVQQIREDN